MSEDGGLEEDEEFFRAAASCSLSSTTSFFRLATSASKASNRACKRRQFGQRVTSLRLMTPYSTKLSAGATTLYR